MTSTPRIAAVIPAAGSGSRMQSSVPKQFLTIGDHSILQLSVAAVSNDPRIEHVFVAINETEHHHYPQQLPDTSPTVSLVPGGATRAESVLLGVLHAINQGYSHVVVHDAARPGLPADVLANVIEQGLATDNGAIVAMPVRDTLKRSEPDQQIIATHVSRDNLWQAQTPQVFSASLLADAISEMGSSHPQLTDEASAMESLGYHPRLVMGSLKNLKVTHPEDLELMTSLLT